MHTAALQPTYYTIPTRHGYVIRDAPVDPATLPDPKLPDANDLAELIAAVFPDQPTIAEQVKRHGIGALRTTDTIEGAMELFHIDRISAHRLLNALELGKRLYAPPTGSMPLIRSIEDVYKHCFALTSRTQEHLQVLLVDTRYQLIHEQTVSIGTDSGLNVRARDVVQPALERRIRSFVLVHNHPSGDPTPSPEDIAFSKEVQHAASIFDIELLDHVIVTSSGYASALNGA